MDGRFGILLKQFVEICLHEVELSLEALVETFVDSAALAPFVGSVEHIDVSCHVGRAFGLRSSKGDDYSFQIRRVANHPKSILRLHIPGLTVS